MRSDWETNVWCLLKCVQRIGRHASLSGCSSHARSGKLIYNHHPRRVARIWNERLSSRVACVTKIGKRASHSEFCPCLAYLIWGIGNWLRQSQCCVDLHNLYLSSSSFLTQFTQISISRNAHISTNFYAIDLA
jgi:hypothetical protein